MEQVQAQHAQQQRERRLSKNDKLSKSKIGREINKRRQMSVDEQPSVQDPSGKKHSA